MASRSPLGGRSPSEQATGTKLRAVLNVIDQSLHALKSQEVVSAASTPAAAPSVVDDSLLQPSASSPAAFGGGGGGVGGVGGGGGGGGGGASFHDAALNSITKSLLETQVDNSRLKEENQELRQLLMSRETTGASPSSGAGGGGGGGGRGGRGKGRSPAGGGRTPPASSSSRRGTFFGLYKNGEGGAKVDDAAATEAKAGAGGGGGSDDLDELLHQMHTLLHRQAQDHFLSRDDGVCFLNHEAARGLVGGSAGQFEALQAAHAQTSENLRAALQGLAAEKDRYGAARFELEQMQDERRKLEEQMRAFEAENMRLTNEVEENRYLKAEKTELESVHNETNKALQKQLHLLTVEKMELARRVEELDRDKMRVTNELEELRYVQQEKADVERSNLQLRAELERVRSGQQ